MTTTEEIHVGDVGTVFQFLCTDAGITLPIDDAIAMTIDVRKPDMTKVTWTGECETDGTDGIMIYTTVDGDLDVDGDWKFQPIVEFPVGLWHSKPVIKRVYPNV